MHILLIVLGSKLFKKKQKSPHHGSLQGSVEMSRIVSSL